MANPESSIRWLYFFLSTRSHAAPVKSSDEYKTMHIIHSHHSLRIIAILLIVLPLSVTYLLQSSELQPITIVMLFLLNLASLLILGGIFYRFISVSFASMKGEPHSEEPDQTVTSQLKKEIEERTSKLEVVQRELEKKERLANIGQLTATVGHELKNSIGAIRLATDVLMSRIEENGSDVSTVTDRIYRNINRSEQIILELKDHAQNQPIKLEQVSLQEFVEQLREDYTHDHAITITWSYPQDVAMACDPGKFERVCINIMDNACHALLETETPNKAINVTVGQMPGKLYFTFEDNGPGIPEQLISQVFEPMFTTKSFGMGLGLSIVKEIMEKHHGGIQIENRSNAGAKVMLWLPHIEGEGSL